MANLVVCCDGTWSTPTEMEHGLPCPTNVVKLYNALVRSEDQATYYHPGVGTGKGWWDHLIGGSTGEGLDHNIKSAYHWLARRYTPEDRIFLFGFSRGAYTVRSLGGLIAKCGLIDLTEATLSPDEVWRRVREVFGAYRQGAPFPNPKNYPFHNAGAGENPAGTVPIHFIGVWDTVGSLGIPDDFALLGLFDNIEKYRFHDTALSPVVAHARHAVALDEMRESFAPTLWSTVSLKTDAEQIWFPGAHADVGGGYLETGLSDGALKWMMDEAVEHGLSIRSGAQSHLKPDPLGIVHDSCTGIFRALKTAPRPAPLIGSTTKDLHQSTLDRQINPPLAQGDYWQTTLLKVGEKRTIDIFAMEHWNRTGLYLECGVQYQLEASGQWLDHSDGFSPAGHEQSGLHLGDIARFASSVLGTAETAFRELTHGRQADFWWTRRIEDAPWFALMGFISSQLGLTDTVPPAGEVFLIGELRTITPQQGGYLYCFANDAWQTYGNNRGSVALKVTRAQ